MIINYPKSYQGGWWWPITRSWSTPLIDLMFLSIKSLSCLPLVICSCLCPSLSYHQNLSTSTTLTATPFLRSCRIPFHKLHLINRYSATLQKIHIINGEKPTRQATHVNKRGIRRWTPQIPDMDQCSEPSGGPTKTTGITPNYPGECRPWLWPPGLIHYSLISIVRCTRHPPPGQTAGDPMKYGDVSRCHVTNEIIFLQRRRLNRSSCPCIKIRLSQSINPYLSDVQSLFQPPL